MKSIDGVNPFPKREHPHRVQKDSSIRTCLIVNPNAGSPESAGELLRLVDRLGDCMFHQTQQPGEAAQLARQSLADAYQRIIVAGGDGTINEVINGLAPDFGTVQLGIIPLGTGNDAARSLAIPTNLAEAFDIVLAGRSRPLDLIRFTNGGTRYFLNASAAGFSGAVDEKIDSDLKSRWGPFAYVLSAAAALPELTQYHLRVALDEHEFSMDAYNVVIANGRYIAGGIPIAPQAQLDDGRLDVIIVPATSLTDAALAASQIIFGRHVESDRVLTTQARRVKIQSDPPMPFNVDGEPLGQAEAHFEVVAGALNVIVGNEAEGLTT